MFNINKELTAKDVSSSLNCSLVTANITGHKSVKVPQVEIQNEALKLRR